MSAGDPNRRRRVKEIARAATRLESQRRADFLERVCEGDSTLRYEVEQLLGSDPSLTALREAGYGSASTVPTRDIDQCLEFPQEYELGPPVSNRFSIIRCVGKGGMGVVYEAYDGKRDMRVALKTMRNADPEALYRFKREFRSLTEIIHPNLIRLYEFIVEGDDCFFTMEMIDDGQDLLTYVHQSPESSCLSTVDFTASKEATGQLDQEQEHSERRPMQPIVDFGRLRNAFYQLAVGVQTLHQVGILHCDLKPSNVLVRSNGQVILLDFGLIAELDSDLAQELGEDAGSGSGSGSGKRVAGTAWYMAPEQAAALSLSEASDWYAFGVMLYRALTGVLPFAGDRQKVMTDKQCHTARTPTELVEYVPSDLNQLCIDLLSREPRERPSGEEILRCLSLPEETPQRRHSPRVAAIPFVGRAEHLQELRNGFHRMCDGRTVVYSIDGKSGTGKSALIERFFAEVVRPGNAVVLSGRCYAQESVPYKALDGLVDILTQYLMQLSPTARAALLPHELAALVRVFPVLGRLEAIDRLSPEVTETADVHGVRLRAQAALRELIANIGRRQPLIVYIDDVHWGDADSAAFLHRLLRGPDQPRMMLLACRRSEFGFNPCVQALTAEQENDSSIDRKELSLGPLTSSESRELAEYLLGTESARYRWYVERIAKESDGIPYFIIELVEQALAVGAAEAQPLGMAEIVLEHVLWSRIDGLSEAEKRLLQTIAVAAQPIAARVALRAADLREADHPLLASLRASHLLCTFGDELEDEIAVFHDRVRETVMGRLPQQARCERHLSLAKSLEAFAPGDSERIAIHYDGAGAPDRACRYYQLAAKRASTQLAFDRAARLYQRSVELLPADDADRKPLIIALADALANAGRGVEAAVQYERAAAFANGIEESELRRQGAYQYLITGHFDAGRDATERVLKSFGLRLAPTPRRALLSLLAQRARLRLRGVRFRRQAEWKLSPYELARVDACWSTSIGLGIIDIVRAAEFQTRGLLYALRTGEPFRVARALALEAIHTSAEGSRARDRTRKLLSAAAQLEAELSDPYITAIITLSRGVTSWLEGDFSQARTHVLEAEKLFFEKCIGTTWERDTARTYETFILVNLGHFHDLAQIAQRYREESESRGDLYAATNIGCYAVPHSLLVGRGDPRAAAEAAQDAIGKWSQGFFHSQHMLSWISQIEVALYEQRGPAAWQLLREQWPTYRRSLIPRVQHPRIQLLYSTGRCAVLAARQSGETRPYRRAARKSIVKLEREGRDWATGLAAIIRGALAHASGQPDEALRQLARAEHLLAAVDATTQAAAVKRRRGWLLGGQTGKELIADAEQWMASQQIADPDRVTNMYLPGFESGR